MHVRRLKSLSLVGFIAVILLFISVTAYGQFSKQSDMEQSDPYRIIGLDSTAFVKTIQQDVNYRLWRSHSLSSIALLTAQLNSIKSKMIQSEVAIRQLGLISLLSPSWSLSLIDEHSTWYRYFQSPINGLTRLSALINDNQSYFKYFIPIIIQNKVVGDYYIIGSSPVVQEGLFHKSTFLLYTNLILLLLLSYFAYRLIWAPDLDVPVSFYALADFIPLIKKQKLSDHISIPSNGNAISTIDHLIMDIINRASNVVIHFNNNGIIDFFNPTASMMTGIEEIDIIGWSVTDLIHELEIPRLRFKSLVENLYANGFILNDVLEFSHYKSKEQHIALVSAIEFSERSDLAGILVLAKDITDLGHVATTDTPYNDRLNLVAEFAASTAHEIRNPLTTVRGFLQLQKKRDQSDRSQSHYRVMIDEIDRVDQLISEYLKLARNSSMHVKEEVILANLLTTLLPLITAEANMRQVEVIVNQIPDGVCLGNANELKQVFLNLCKNSLDAMEHGGQLIINSRIENNACIIMIKDTGIGISEEVIQRIFKPFFTTKPSGTGLGLSVSKKIIESHNGTISVESEPGKGTVFYLTIPLIK